jgi:hypothetical protein
MLFEIFTLLAPVGRISNYGDPYGMTFDAVGGFCQDF